MTHRDKAPWFPCVTFLAKSAIKFVVGGGKVSTYLKMFTGLFDMIILGTKEYWEAFGSPACSICNVMGDLFSFAISSITNLPFELLLLYMQWCKT